MNFFQKKCKKYIKKKDKKKYFHSKLELFVKFLSENYDLKLFYLRLIYYNVKELKLEEKNLFYL